MPTPIDRIEDRYEPRIDAAGRRRWPLPRPIDPVLLERAIQRTGGGSNPFL